VVLEHGVRRGRVRACAWRSPASGSSGWVEAGQRQPRRYSGVRGGCGTSFHEVEEEEVLQRKAREWESGCVRARADQRHGHTYARAWLLVVGAVALTVRGAFLST
jgi:hypothetical protein